jgi:hypothetical protein
MVELPLEIKKKSTIFGPETPKYVSNRLKWGNERKKDFFEAS